MAHSTASAPELVKNTASAKVASHEPLRQPLLLGDPVDVGGVPELLRLLAQRRDEMRMGVAQRVDRDADAEIEISLALLGVKTRALAPREGKLAAGVGRKEGRHETALSLK